MKEKIGLDLNPLRRRYEITAGILPVNVSVRNTKGVELGTL